MSDGHQSKKVILGISMFIAFMLIHPASAHAFWGHHGGYHQDRGHHYRDYGHHHYPYGRSVVVLPHHSFSIVIGNGRFYYSEGYFYRRRSRDYVVVEAPIGAVVYSIPGGCRRVIVAGAPYYTYEGVYYQPMSRGYRVVEPPSEVEDAPLVASAVPVSSKSQDAFTVNIPNATSGYTSVTLKRSGNGYVGPQGEFYPEFPKVEQLRTMYAK